MSWRVSKNKAIFGILLVVFFTKRFWGLNVPWYISPIMAFVGIIYSFTIRSSYKNIKYIWKRHFKMVFYPYLIIYIYTVILWALKSNLNVSNDMWSSAISTTIYMILANFFAVAVFRIFGRKSIDFAFKCALYSYLGGSVIYLFIRFGILQAITYLLTLSYSNPYLNYTMEVHDLTFAFGLFAIYYACFEKEKSKKIKNTILCFLVIYWGWKRIEILALAACWLIYICFTKSKKNFKIKSKIIGIMITIVSYLYLFIIHNHSIESLAERYGINFMGRLGAYRYIVEKFSDFSPDFFGTGFIYIDETIVQLRLSGLKIGDSLIINGLHSDTLKLYIELGFIGFAVWLLYQVFVRTTIIYKKFGERVASMYIMITCYLFILYMTDNVYGYTSVLFATMLILLGESIAENSNKITELKGVG